MRQGDARPLFFLRGRGKHEEITGNSIVVSFTWFRRFIRRGEDKQIICLNGGRHRNECGATTVAKSRSVEQAQ
jgi:hypothetical protein